MKKRFTILLTTILLFAMPITVHATESTEFGRTGTGDKQSRCNVTFVITDESGGYPGDSFKAIMVDVTGTISDEYTFTLANSWGGKNVPKYSVIAPTTYNVTFEGLEEGYTIVNTLDYSTKISFAAAAEGVADVYWSIISTSTDMTEQEGNVQSNESELLDKKFDVTNEEAGRIFDTFLNAAAIIEKDDTWSNFLNKYSVFDKSEWYEKYVQGGSAEEYKSMSLFDRFIYEETYLRFSHMMNTGDRDMYFGSEERFRSNFLNSTLDLMTGNDNEQVKEAYTALALWQLNYIKENGIPFNFINDRSYLEEVSETPKEESKPSESEEMKEAFEELVKDAEMPIEEEPDKKGVWGDTVDLLAKNLLTIAILIVLAIAAGVVIWKRKRLNIDEDNDSN